MQIKKSSWHYKLNDELSTGFHKKNQHSLCGYFWTTVLSLIKAVGLIGFCVFVVFWAGGFLLSPYAAMLGLFVSPTNAMPLTSMVLQVIIALILLGKYMKGRLPSRGFKVQKPKEPKEPNLLAEYLKAKKRRICPILEVE